MVKKLICLVLGCCFAFPVLAAEVELTPLKVSNQAPLAQLVGLPSLDRARLLGDGEYEAGFSWDLANNYTRGGNPSEQLVFDGESHRIALRLKRGFAAGWEAGVEVPLLAHREGFLDGFIESWHDLFGLPQGGRELAADQQLDYLYQKNGTTGFSLQNEEIGLGDIRLLLSRELYRESTSALALHASLELPSGDDEKLLGSGSFDFAVWLSGEQLWQPAGKRLALHWGGGVLVAGSGELLADQRRPLVATGTLGVAWALWPWLALQLQVDAHSSLFKDSGLRQLSESSAQLAIGGALAVAEQTRLELAVVEDIAVDTASDVNFHLALSRRF